MPDTLPPLSPIEQRSEELAEEVAMLYERLNLGWLSPSVWSVRILARMIARRALPIWRRHQERVAQRTAELVAEILRGEK